MKLPQTKLVEVFVDSKELNNLKIIHLSDLHIDKKIRDDTLIDLVNVCDKEDSEFVVITGDIIDCKVKYIKDKLAILNNIKKKVYYISGNHDLYYGLDDLKKELTNFYFVDNHRETIYFNGNDIHIVGLSDRFSKFFKKKRDIDKVINYLNESTSTIFLAHQPKDYKIAVNTQTPLFLCGHTHGGQIFPFHFLVRLVQPFLAGLSYKEKTAIYVNRGLGTWGINFRFKAPAELTILKLTTKSVK